MKNFASTPLTEAIGWVLLHSLWQGLLLATLLFVFFKVNKTASKRYWAGLTTLLAQGVVSLFTFAWYWQNSISIGAQPVVAPIQSNPVTVTNSPLISSESSTWLYQLETYLPFFVQVWLIGVVLFWGRLVLNFWYADRLKQTPSQPIPAAVTQLFEQLSSHVSLRLPVRLLVSMEVTVPMVIGHLKPAILLPLGLVTRLSAKQLEAVLAHELAHLMRQDFAINLVQTALEGLYFFNPAIWWISAKVREERENACDDFAVRFCGNRHVLAQALAQVETYRQEPVLAMAFGAKKMPLLQRIQRILGVTSPNTHEPKSALFLIGMIGLVGVLMAFQPQEKPTQAKQKTPKATAQPKVSTTRVAKPKKATSYTSTPHRVRWSDESLTELDSATKAKIKQHKVEISKLHQELKPYEEQLHLLEKQMHAQSAQMRVYEVPMRAQEKEMRKIEEKYRPYLRKQEELGRLLRKKQGEKEQEQLMTQLEQNEKILDGFHKETEAIHEEMEKHHQQLEKLHEPLDSLNQKIEALVEEKMEVIFEEIQVHNQAIAELYGFEMPPPPPPPARVSRPTLPTDAEWEQAAKPVRAPRAPKPPKTPPPPPPKPPREK